MSNQTVTKFDVVNQVMDQLGFTRPMSKKVIESLIEVMKKKLAAGEDVLISNFGKFCVCEKCERRGRNPATGEDMFLPARKVVTFKCSKYLRKRMNGNNKFNAGRRRKK